MIDDEALIDRLCAHPMGLTSEAIWEHILYCGGNNPMTTKESVRVALADATPVDTKKNVTYYDAHGKKMKKNLQGAGKYNQQKRSLLVRMAKDEEWFPTSMSAFCWDKRGMLKHPFHVVYQEVKVGKTFKADTNSIMLFSTHPLNIKALVEILNCQHSWRKGEE